MRVAIVHDYLAQAGGAERVVEAMHAVFPEAPIFTSVYDPDATLPSFRGMDVRTSFLQRFAGKARLHKLALPLYPLAFENFDLSAFDVVLSSTSGFAKGVITSPDTCHICYCHTPSRFAWRYHEYIAQGGHGRGLVGRLLPAVAHHQRLWDYACAQRVDHFVANSHNIRRRIRKFYGRRASVLYPPVDTTRFRPAPAAEVGEHLLVVSRLVGYKRVDLAVEACTRLGLPLRVVGSGPDAARLKAAAGPTVEFLGRLPDGRVAEELSRCRALLFPGEEDLGITPLEAMAAGRPVVAFRGGGALETVVEGETGHFFDSPDADSLIAALRRLGSADTFDPARVRAHAERFDSCLFRARLRAMVELRWAEHRHGLTDDDRHLGPLGDPLNDQLLAFSDGRLSAFDVRGRFGTSAAADGEEEDGEAVAAALLASGPHVPVGKDAKNGLAPVPPSSPPAIPPAPAAPRRH